MMLKNLLLLSLLAVISLSGEEPVATYLTWQQDPSTTMTVTWITESDDTQDILEIKQKNKLEWLFVVGEHVSLPGDDRYLIHRAQVGELLPDTGYDFKTGPDAKHYRFKTMPTTLDRPVRFVVGGDVYHDDLPSLTETNRQAAAQSPMFAVLGGDLAYAGVGSFFRKEKTHRWIEWLQAWTEDMITPEGYMIPMLTTIGNHDVNGYYNKTSAHAKNFYALFAMPGPQGFNVLDFNEYMSLILLDSGHSHPINGTQKHWLYQTLLNRQSVPNTFAFYHVPAYPSVRKMRTKKSPAVRKHWVPIFQQFGLNVAFEHHDHAYKRTYPLTDGKKDPEGVVYLGDGAWGVKTPRKPKDPELISHFAFTQSVRHFILVTLDKDKRLYEAISSEGELVDSFEQKTAQINHLEKRHKVHLDQQ